MRFVKYFSTTVTIILILFSGTAIAATKQFDHSLYLGVGNDPDVYYLQEFLRSFGFFNYPISTGFYGNATASAVKKFQIANNISPVGTFGPLTRTLANRIIVAQGIKFNPPPVIVKNVSQQDAANNLSGVSATSTAKDKIVISSVGHWSDNPSDQYITLHASVGNSSDSVDITGFKIVNSSGNEFVIPKAHKIPGVNAIAEDDIILRSYDTVNVQVGQTGSHLDFEENLCTGYLDETSDYGNKLSHNCPKPSYASQLNVLPDFCVQIFDQAPTCRTIPNEKLGIQACLDFATSHFNYQGCLADFKNRSDFESGNWLVWMQKSVSFVRQIHDVIILYDREGKIVDQYSY